jgi:SagB-type dehydrogenase family enzyme
MTRRLWGAIMMIASVGAAAGSEEGRVFTLPEPSRTGEVSVEEAVALRRSVRDYSSGPLSLQQLSQLAWAAQGVTDEHRGFRAAPSAGATFPLELDLLVHGSDELPDGVYRYLPHDHALALRVRGDHRGAVSQAALHQTWLRDAPVILVISAVTARTEARYGARAERYVYMEAGHVAQNVYLQATALGLATVAVGAFDDDALATILELAGSERPLYVLPLGRAR